MSPRVTPAPLCAIAAVTPFFAVFLATGAAHATAPDMTVVDKIVCTVERIALCKPDGGCAWKDASARDRSRKMIVDFNVGEAFMTRGTTRSGDESRPPRRLGALYDVSVSDGRRRFVIARRPDSSERSRYRIAVHKDGAAAGSRGRARFEGTCEKG